MPTRAAFVMATFTIAAILLAGSLTLAKGARSDGLARLTGVAIGREGRPWPRCLVAVFPGDVAPDVRSRLARLEESDQAGQFTLSRLPAGSYLLTASPDINPVTWLTDDSLERLSRIAARVVMRRGETRRVTLPCSRLP